MQIDHGMPTATARRGITYAVCILILHAHGHSRLQQRACTDHHRTLANMREQRDLDPVVGGFEPSIKGIVY